MILEILRDLYIYFIYVFLGDKLLYELVCKTLTRGYKSVDFLLIYLFVCSFYVSCFAPRDSLFLFLQRF